MPGTCNECLNVPCINQSALHTRWAAYVAVCTHKCLCHQGSHMVALHTEFYVLQTTRPMHACCYHCFTGVWGRKVWGTRSRSCGGVAWSAASSLPAMIVEGGGGPGSSRAAAVSVAAAWAGVAAPARAGAIAPRGCSSSGGYNSLSGSLVMLLLHP